VIVENAELVLPRHGCQLAAFWIAAENQRYEMARISRITKPTIRLNEPSLNLRLFHIPKTSIFAAL